MANYEAPLLKAPVGTAFLAAGVLYVPTAAQRRFMVYEVEFGQAGALATTDCQDQWDLSRFGTTAAMAGSGAIATNLLDPADVASSTLFQNNMTTDPTYTTAGNGLNLKSWSINQRGSYRWRALDDGDNIIVPATTNFGVGIRTLSVTSGFTASAVGNVSFIER